MSAPEFRDATEARLIPMTEADLARDPREPGRVLQHRGRYWRQSAPGLFEPIHPLARLTGREATAPSRACWGYQAALADPFLDHANASRPMHMLVDLESFGPDRLSSNRRYHLRRSQRSVEFVELVGSRLLEREGYAVFRSAQGRTRNPYRAINSETEFLAEMAWFSRPSAVVLGGLVDGRLGGWIAGYAVDDTAYVEIVDLATEALTTHISTGLHFAFVEACRRSERIREIVHSPHIPEDHALAVFKEGIGFPVVHVPSRVWLAPLVDRLMQWRKPYTHYRLTGRPITRAGNEGGKVLA